MSSEKTPLAELCRTLGLGLSATYLRLDGKGDSRQFVWKVQIYHAQGATAHRIIETEYRCGLGHINKPPLDNRRFSGGGSLPLHEIFHDRSVAATEVREAWYYNRLAPIEPTTADVLAVLVSNASAGCLDFDEFCGEFGYDTDSRKAHRTWRKCQKTYVQLVRELGSDLLEQLQSAEH